MALIIMSHLDIRRSSVLFIKSVVNQRSLMKSAGLFNWLEVYFSVKNTARLNHSDCSFCETIGTVIALIGRESF